MAEDRNVDAGDLVVAEAALLGKNHIFQVWGDGAPRCAELLKRRLRAEQRNAQDDCIFFAATTTMAMMATRRIRRFMAAAYPPPSCTIARVAALPDHTEVSVGHVRL